MFAFAGPEHVTEVLTAAGWTAATLREARHGPRYRRRPRGLEEAVVQSTEIGAVNSWLRNQPAQGR
jgi:hypothetical protein